MVLVVVAAKEVLWCKGGHGAVDGLVARGVARGAHLAVEGEIHLIDPLRAVVSEQGLVVRAEHLSPDGVVSAVLQLISYFAAPQLLLGYFRALLVFTTAGVEVVTVVEGGVGGDGVAIFVAAVVRASVEAGVQGAGAILVTYKSAHACPACTGAVD